MAKKKLLSLGEYTSLSDEKRKEYLETRRIERVAFKTKIRKPIVSKTIKIPDQLNELRRVAVEKMMPFYNGSYIDEELTTWLLGKPAEKGWYDTIEKILGHRWRKGDQRFLKDELHKLPYKVQRAGRSYWDGNCWRGFTSVGSWSIPDHDPCTTLESFGVRFFEHIAYRGLSNPPQ